MRRLGELFWGRKKDKAQSRHMSLHLQQWLKDADAFGIRENVQKGLLYFSGIELCLQGIPEGQSAEKVMARMSRHLYFDKNGLIDLPTGVGATFDSLAIGGLLWELIRQIDPHFVPRMVRLPGLSTMQPIPSFNPCDGITLPTFRKTLASSAQLSESFYGQMGDHIEGFEPEEIIVAGMRLFNGYTQLDQNNMLTVCRFALKMRPPHYAWIGQAFTDELENISSTEAFAKVMAGFCSSDCAEYALARAICKRITLTATPEQMMDSMFVCRQAISTALDLVSEEDLSPVVTRYAQHLRAIPDYTFFRDSSNEAVNDLLNQVEKEWGYADIGPQYSNLAYGERLDRLCCIIIASMRDATWRKIPVRPKRKPLYGRFPILVYV